MTRNNRSRIYMMRYAKRAMQLCSVNIREKLQGQTTTSYALTSNVGGYKSLVREMEEREDRLKDEMAGMFSREDIEKVWDLCYELDAEPFEVHQQPQKRKKVNQAAEMKSNTTLARSELKHGRKEVLIKDQTINDQKVALDKLLSLNIGGKRTWYRNDGEDSRTSRVRTLSLRVRMNDSFSRPKLRKKHEMAPWSPQLTKC